MQRSMLHPHKSRPSVPGSPPLWQRAWWLNPALLLGVVLSVGLGLYLHTLNAPFIFDDFPCVKENPAIRGFDYFFDYRRVLALNIPEDIKNNFALRPIAYLSFALNYSSGGLSPFGFHLVNTGIHLGNALLVYGLVAVTLRQMPQPSANDAAALYIRLLPLLVALLFVSHPLQTQAVTYITQRFTSLCTLFYLGALYLYVLARHASSLVTRRLCYAASLLAAVLAMWTKEIAFTLPVVILLYDLLFLEGTARVRLRAMLPILLTMAVIPLTLFRLTRLKSAGVPTEVIDQSMNLLNFAKVGRWDYFKTEFGVVVAYLRLLFLPIGQNFDHDYRLATGFFEWRVAGALLFLLALLAAAVVLARRSLQNKERFAERLVAFGILWFFVTLAVESTIIPIEDLLVEHRLYLPSFGIFLAVGGALLIWVDREPRALRCVVAGAVVCVVALGTLTIGRNNLYRDAIRIMEDVARKSPEKTRAHVTLGNVYLEGKRYAEAIAEFSRVLQETPQDANTLVNFGTAKFYLQEYDAALRAFQAALRVAPENFSAHCNLGLAFFKVGRTAEAEQELQRALQLNPHHGPALAGLARLYAQQGRRGEAIAQYAALLQSYPEDRAAAESLRQLTRQ